MSEDAVQAAYRAVLARAGSAPEHVFILLASADKPWPAVHVDGSDGGRITYVTVEHPLEQVAAAMLEVEDGSSRLANTDTYAFDRTGRLYHQRRAASNNLGPQILVPRAVALRVVRWRRD